MDFGSNPFNFNPGQHFTSGNYGYQGPQSFEQAARQQAEFNRIAEMLRRQREEEAAKARAARDAASVRVPPYTPVAPKCLFCGMPHSTRNCAIKPLDAVIV